jgi:hypothetical protein
MKTWPEFTKTKMIESVFEDPDEQEYWLNILEHTYKGLIDTWDYQWLYTRWLQSDLSIIPNSNLVSNIGFCSDATHTFGDMKFLSKLPLSHIEKIKHPPFVLRNRVADAYTFDNFHKHDVPRKNQALILRLYRKILLLKNKINL